MDLTKLSALDIGNFVNSKITSAEEVMTYFLERIHRINPKINAFVYVKEDEALEEAKKVDEKIRKDGYAGKFAGVPVALKNFLPSKTGWVNDRGGVKFLTQKDKYDSEFYKAVHSEGAIAVGKTNSPQFGFSGLCDNPVYGPTKNPFYTAYNSGGSSGGSAAAVAAGLIPIAEGGDAGGSIRIPSAWCNCFGMKPSFGLIPNYCRPDGWSATHPFCTGMGITKTVDDSRAVFDAMCKHDTRDPFSVSKNVLFETLAASKNQNLKIAFTHDFDLFPADAETSRQIILLINLLRSEGFEVTPVEFNFKHSLDTMADVWCWSILLDTAIELSQDYTTKDLRKDFGDQLSPEFIYYYRQAKVVNLNSLKLFNEVKTDILDQLENVFDKYDLLISPVTCCRPVQNGTDGNTRGPAKIFGRNTNTVIGFAETFFANFIGYPAAAVPVGFGDDLMPVGLQVTARKFHDLRIYNFCKYLETINPWKDNYSKIMVEEESL